MALAVARKDKILSPHVQVPLRVIIAMRNMVSRANFGQIPSAMDLVPNFNQAWRLYSLTGDKVCMNGLPNDMDNDGFQTTFWHYQRIRSFELLQPNADGTRSAFVTANSADDATWMVQNLDGTVQFSAVKDSTGFLDSINGKFIFQFI